MKNDFENSIPVRMCTFGQYGQAFLAAMMSVIAEFFVPLSIAP
jgi:hypothetical protein